MLFDSRLKYFMEKRTPAGALDFSQPQPPFMICTERQICDHYFLKNPGPDPSATQEQILAWYKAQGFVWRVKTW